MKQHLSVFMLYIRSSVYKVLLLLIGMAAVECAFFWWTLHDAMTMRDSLLAAGEQFDALREDAYRHLDNIMGLEAILENSYIVYIFIAFSLLITIVLCLIGCERGNKQGYTLRRLSIPESAVVLWQSLCNTCCYFLLWVAQIGIALGLCQWYVSKTEAVSNQTIFLAFYRNVFLHNVLPLDETSLWVRNVLLLFSFGMASACFSFRQRQGKFAAEIIALFWATLVWCSRDLGSIITDIFAILCCVMVIGVEFYRIFAKEVPDEA